MANLIQKAQVFKRNDQFLTKYHFQEKTQNQKIDSHKLQKRKIFRNSFS